MVISIPMMDNKGIITIDVVEKKLHAKFDIA